MTFALIYLFSSIALHAVLAKTAMPVAVPEVQTTGEVIYLPFAEQADDQLAA
jgi:hypothetical protein